MSLPNLLSGLVPTGDDLTTLQPVFAYKTANEDTGANNTTLQNDDHLFVAGVANAIYVVDTHFEVQGAGNAAAGNLKFAWTYPTGAGAQFSWSIAGMATNDITGATTEGKGSYLAAFATTSPSTPSIVAGTPSANWAGIIGRGLWIVGATGGALQLQWAQQANSATASVMRAGSFVQLTRVS